MRAFRHEMKLICEFPSESPCPLVFHFLCSANVKLFIDKDRSLAFFVYFSQGMAFLSSKFRLEQRHLFEQRDCPNKGRKVLYMIETPQQLSGYIFRDLTILRLHFSSFRMNHNPPFATENSQLKFHYEFDESNQHVRPKMLRICLRTFSLCACHPPM